MSTLTKDDNYSWNISNQLTKPAVFTVRIWLRMSHSEYFWTHTNIEASWWHEEAPMGCVALIARVTLSIPPVLYLTPGSQLLLLKLLHERLLSHQLHMWLPSFQPSLHWWYPEFVFLQVATENLAVVVGCESLVWQIAVFIMFFMVEVIGVPCRWQWRMRLMKRSTMQWMS